VFYTCVDQCLSPMEKWPALVNHQARATITHLLNASANADIDSHSIQCSAACAHVATAATINGAAVQRGAQFYRFAPKQPRDNRGTSCRAQSSTTYGSLAHTRSAGAEQVGHAVSETRVKVTVYCSGRQYGRLV
jgi:hypothetical protein